jgi:hypothetical protein
MSSAALAPVVPGSVERGTKQQPQMKISPQQDIANVAYALWQQRGCPEGSPEQDWFEAEAIVRTGK